MTDKGTLEIYTAFAILCRRAVDRLRHEAYGRDYPGEKEVLREDLNKLRAEALTQAHKQHNVVFYNVVWLLAEALYEQLMISHQMMRCKYHGQSGYFLHVHLHAESCDRAEVLLTKILDLGMQGALGENPESLSA